MSLGAGKALAAALDRAQRAESLVEEGGMRSSKAQLDAQELRRSRESLTTSGESCRWLARATCFSC